MGHPKIQGQGDSQRQQRAGEIIRRALAEVLRDASRFHEALERLMISITNVRMSPDLKLARVYVIPLSSDDHDPKEVLTILNGVRPRLRQTITPMIRMKFMPDLRFFWDDSFEQALRIETLFQSDRVQRDLRIVGADSDDPEVNH